MGLFDSSVLENIGNTILVFFKNCYCFLNLVFFVFSILFRKKKTKNQKCYVFSLLFLFFKTKIVSKTINKQALCLLVFFIILLVLLVLMFA